MANRVEGRIAIVTGSGSGIGQANGEALAKKGADVVTYLEDQRDLEEGRRRVEAAGRRALSLRLEVRDPKALAEAFAGTKPELRRTMMNLGQGA